MDAYDLGFLRMAKAGEWIELSVEADREAVEAVSEILGRYGHQGGVAIEEAHRRIDDGVSIEPDLDKPVWVRTYIPQDGRAEETVQQAGLALQLLNGLRPVGPLQIRALSEEDWANAWKAYYPVLQVGERLVVVPAWRRFRPRPEQVVLRLDPGMAFGTGLHPTTQLCLRAIERYARPEMRTLDLGTGSGILAIAAVKLGITSILAVDKDPVAVQAARQNARRNRQARNIEIREGTLAPGMGPFDLILGNLLARVLLDLAGLLAGALAPGGILIASGVLIEQAEEVTAALRAVGLDVFEQPRQGDWVALLARR